MALENINYPNFRSDPGRTQRLTITELDSMQLFNYNLAMASYNSLQYLSTTWSIESSSDLGSPETFKFNSRNLPSNFYPFDNGSTFVFNFSENSYGPGTTPSLGAGLGATYTYNWWKSLDLVEATKILTISQIARPGNYFEYEINTISYNTATQGNFWRVNATKKLGPTFAGATGFPYAFSPTASYLISYRTVYGASGASGASPSIGGTIEGDNGEFYTYFNNDPISNKIYLGSISSKSEISFDGENLLYNNTLFTPSLVFSMSSTQSFRNLPYNFNSSWTQSNVISTSDYIIQPTSAAVQILAASNDSNTPYTIEMRANNEVFASATFSGAITSYQKYFLGLNGKGFSGDSVISLTATSSGTWSGISFSSSGIARVVIVYNKLSNASIGFDPEI